LQLDCYLRWQLAGAAVKCTYRIATAKSHSHLPIRLGIRFGATATSNWQGVIMIDFDCSQQFQHAWQRLQEDGGAQADRYGGSDPGYYSMKIVRAAQDPTTAGPKLKHAMALWNRIEMSLATEEGEPNPAGWDSMVRRLRAFAHAIDQDDLEAGQAESIGKDDGTNLPELPEEIGAREAAAILRVSKDTVLKYRDMGVLPSRNIAPPGSSRPIYRFPLDAVVKLRSEYTLSEPPVPTTPTGPTRRRVSGRREFKHLDLGDG
jgi:hypothetical protein